MHEWISFFNLIFWLSIIGFLVNYSNFLFLFLFSETIWIIIYTSSVIFGLYLDDLNVISNSFFVLGLAGIEFAIGFLLLVSFKKFNISYNLIENSSLKIFKQNNDSKSSMFNV